MNIIIFSANNNIGDLFYHKSSDWYFDDISLYCLYTCIGR